jgi:hypothetical protein
MSLRRQAPDSSSELNRLITVASLMIYSTIGITGCITPVKKENRSIRE